MERLAGSPRLSLDCRGEKRKPALPLRGESGVFGISSVMSGCPGVQTVFFLCFCQFCHAGERFAVYNYIIIAGVLSGATVKNTKGDTIHEKKAPDCGDRDGSGAGSAGGRGDGGNLLC